jgi:competence protein ComEC
MRARVLCACLLCAAAGFGAAGWSARRQPPMPEPPKRAALVSGTVAAIDLLPEGGRRLTVQDPVVAPAVPRRGSRPAAMEAQEPGERWQRRLRVRLRAGDATPLSPGDRMVLRAMLRPPAAPDRPGGRDPQREAFFSGLGGSGTALSPVVRLGSAAGGSNAEGWLRRLRERIAARITAALPGVQGAIGATLMTGLGTAIPQADRDAFAASGLAHILAVAGLHLAIVMGLVTGFVRFALAFFEWTALRLPGRQLAALAGLLGGGGYMFLTGLHLPGLRALAMASVVVLALLLGRRTLSMRGLAVAALLILLFEPAVLLEVGFQMSFAAVLALIAGYDALRPWLLELHLKAHGGWRHRVALHVVSLLLTSLFAGAASLPYAMFHFGRMQLYFVLANLLAVPVTAFWVMPQGLLALAAMPFGLQGLFLRPMGWGIDLILFLARRVAALPAASMAVPAMPPAGLVCLSAGLVGLCLLRGRTPRLLALLPLALGLLSPWLARQPDLLVSNDARLIALREGSGLLVEQSSGASPLVLKAWQQGWATTEPPRPFPEAGTVAGVSCTAELCRIARNHQLVLLLRDAARDGPDDDQGGRDDDLVDTTADDSCAGAGLLVAPMPAEAWCRGVPRIDRFTVWRTGAQAVWLRSGAIRVVSDRDWRGTRLWVPPVPSRSGRRPTLPLAAAE